MERKEVVKGKETLMLLLAVVQYLSRKMMEMVQENGSQKVLQLVSQEEIEIFVEVAVARQPLLAALFDYQSLLPD